MLNNQRLLVALTLAITLSPTFVSAEYVPLIKKNGNAADRQQDRRQDNRQDHRQDVRQVTRQVKRKVDRSRSFRNIYIVRPFGHVYAGYGSFHNDNDAYKWLAFTAITLKILDNVNEDAQRKHEAAQVAATTAKVGEKIVWSTTQSSGYVVTTKEGLNSTGLTCREFQQTIKVGGKNESAYGTACLQSDGAWKIIS